LLLGRERFAGENEIRNKIKRLRLVPAKKIANNEKKIEIR
jgi:hypothetical protein